MNILEVRDLRYRFPDGTRALDGIDVTIGSGEFIVLAGRNGSGKTVFMKHLNGLMRPETGSVTVHGTTTVDDPVYARNIVGLVFQNPDTQFVGQTVLEEVRFGPENLKLPEEEIVKRADHALLITELTSLTDRRPHTLSGGEKRRLAVAGVLAMEPEVLVLDEPFSGLDLAGTRDVITGILELYGSGHTIIIITHEIEKILAHAERMLIMEKGKIVGDGHPSDLLSTARRFGIYVPPHTPLEKMSWMD